jgi:hypothetical protein
MCVQIFNFNGLTNLKARATVKRPRPQEGTGEGRLSHGRTTAEFAECLAERVAAVRVAEREQAGGHLLGYTDLVRDFTAEWKEAEKAPPPPRG